jgi:hypothetical protein
MVLLVTSPQTNEKNGRAAAKERYDLNRHFDYMCAVFTAVFQHTIDYAESHGMTHGAFRDFLKTNGEAKSSEQLATERAVAKARAAVAAKQKVIEIQAGGRKLDGKLMDAELQAQV